MGGVGVVEDILAEEEEEVDMEEEEAEEEPRLEVSW